ncbi:MAG: Cocaine esterase [Promethearchaeota archaeon]|nr:MAG: Cocaine esterase [Candidatus Lokiarchaeota archaeon]
MIDWIIFLFLTLESMGFLNLFQMLAINFPFLATTRAFYISSYIVTHNKSREDESGEVKLFKKKEKYLFSLKQLVILLFGIIYLPIAIFIGFYSMLMGGSYLSKLKKDSERNYFSKTGSLLNILVPIIGVSIFIILENLYALAAVSLSLLAYLHYGKTRSNLSLSDLKKKKTHRKLNNLPLAAKFTLLIVLIVFPSSIIIATGVYTNPQRREVMIEMRDGVNLATDIHFAPGSLGSPRTVVLIRTPYGKRGWAYDLYSQLYLSQRYHMVIQDLRGTYDSEGGTNFLLFTKSYQDGVDTIEYIMEQPWCNGKIASAGVSALCINQYFYAGMNPDGLLAQQLWFGTPELFDHAIFQGAYHQSSVEKWVQSTAPENWEYQIETIFNYMPKDTQMYNSTSLSIPIGPHYSNVSTYGIHVGGWYDHFLQGTIDGYIGYDDFGAERARGHQKLIMGPWTHGSIYGGKQGELTYPKNSNGFNLILDWEQEVFDSALLGKEANWDDARVAYYLMGDVDQKSEEWNYWRYTYDWPLDHVKDKWYLQPDGRLSNESIAQQNKEFSYLFDPRDPVPNLGGQNQPFDLSGPYDQRPIEDQTDVIIFETEELTEAVEIVGRIWGNLYVSSNCTDTDFTIKLTDVYPDGRSMLITDGAATMRYRNDYTTPELLSGDKNDVYEIMIDCWSSSYVFAPGHKIRIAISSSNYPRFAVNPNTGAPLARDYLNYNIADNSIFVGNDYPSSIILPRLVNVSSTHVIY